MRIHDDWSVFLEQRDLTKEPPAWLSDWRGDGIISRVTTPSLIEAVKATGVPLVELTDRHEDRGLIQVRSDDAAIGKVAAEHLLERGFRRFGYCGFTNEAWSDRRQQGFIDAIAAEGFGCQVYRSAWDGSNVLSWDQSQRHLVQWLHSMARPCGVMACNDMRGQQVLDACALASMAVPEEVAVVGVDNDTLLCSLCDPPLSSVIPNSEAVGFSAAELLSKMMDGEQPVQREFLVEPLSVARRQSTDVVAVDDIQVATALQFIRQNACRGISVADVTDNVAISRSSLERKLRKFLGRTPQQEIRNVQVKRVSELLATTDLTAERIADLCGFEHAEYMYVVFKRETGMTPGAFRERAQPR